MKYGKFFIVEKERGDPSRPKLIFCDKCKKKILDKKYLFVEEVFVNSKMEFEISANLAVHIRCVDKEKIRDELAIISQFEEMIRNNKIIMSRLLGINKKTKYEVLERENKS